MDLKFVIATLAMVTVVAGCATRASSVILEPVQRPKWEGPVFVSQAPLPAGIKYTVIGSVEANARVGYDSAASLYPLLAAEAKKIGANAVIGATGGRRMTAFSWAAAYVSGTAVKVEDPEKLKGLAGSYH
jgi:hypothetical protein